MSETNSTINETDELEVEKPIPAEEPEQPAVAGITVPLWTLPREEQLRLMEKFWREMRPVDSGGIPYLTRDELHDRR